MTYYNVTWNPATADQVTISNGTVTSSSSSTSFVSKAQSTQTIASGKSIKITNWNATGKALAGIGKDPYAGGSTAEYTSVEWGVYYDSGTFSIYESGTDISQTWSGTASDTIYVKYEGSQIKYYSGPTLKYTSTVAPSGTLYAHATLRENGSITIEQDVEETTIAAPPSSPEGAPVIEHLLYLNTRVPK